ncbi:hypothetical protein [Haloprofundus salilacus]|uniref:hypothetical protein n=1 Tax=Haloprofundus salilacus TaxID=2876190 RepID=UPI001CCAE51D|nr:hypothetical protein [Haloprofundus salilacus]
MTTYETDDPIDQPEREAIRSLANAIVDHTERGDDGRVTTDDTQRVLADARDLSLLVLEELGRSDIEHQRILRAIDRTVDAEFPLWADYVGGSTDPDVEQTLLDRAEAEYEALEGETAERDELSKWLDKKRWDEQAERQ